MKAIIIGSGISGLTTGAALAKAGHQVILFEQHHTTGGVTATVEKDGFHWDLGQLLVEGLGDGEPIGEIYKDLGIHHKLNAVKDFRGYVFPDFELRKPESYAGVKWRIDALKQRFPEDAAGLDRYWKDYIHFIRLMTYARRMGRVEGLKKLYWQVRLYLALRPLLTKLKWSASRLMDHYFQSEELKMVFISILADFFSSPDDFPGLGVFTLNYETFYDERIPAELTKNAQQLYLYSLKNGIQSLTQPLIELISENGGEIHIESPVEKIVVENGRTTGVQVGGVFHPANVVIASGTAKNIFFNLIGQEHLSQEFINLVENQALMGGVFMVHLGIDFDPSPYVHGVCTYYYGTYALSEAIQRLENGEYHEGADGFVVHIPTLHTPEMAPEGHHALTIYTICPNELPDWDWDEAKEALADRLIEYAEAYIPGLKEHTVTRVIYSPREFQHRTATDHFAFGGLAPRIEADLIPHRTPLEGLWFVGAQSQSGGGLPNVLPAAYHVAKEIIKENPR